MCIGLCIENRAFGKCDYEKHCGKGMTPTFLFRSRALIKELLLALAISFVLTGCVQIVRPNYVTSVTQLRAGQYTLDPDHAYLTFRIGHLGLSTIVGRFNGLNASLDFDPKKMIDMQLDGIIDMQSIDLNNSDLEERLRGAAWFNTSQFPAASFSTRDVSQSGQNQFQIIGELDLRGIKRPVTLDAVFHGGADNILTGKYTIGFSATAQIKRSEFGMDAFAALVSDDISIEIHAEFQRN